MSTKWNAKIQFPSDSDFIVRLTNVEFGESKSKGNPMLIVESELVSPDEKEVGGEIIDISGVNFTNYMTLTGADADKKEGNIKRAKDFLALCLPDQPQLVADFNPENPSPDLLKALKGKCLFVQISPDEEPARKNPTQAQIDAAKKANKRPVGDLQKHPITGKPIINYWPKIREWFGLAPEAAGANKPY